MLLFVGCSGWGRLTMSRYQPDQEFALHGVRFPTAVDIIKDKQRRVWPSEPYMNPAANKDTALLPGHDAHNDFQAHGAGGPSGRGRNYRMWHQRFLAARVRQPRLRKILIHRHDHQPFDRPNIAIVLKELASVKKQGCVTQPLLQRLASTQSQRDVRVYYQPVATSGAIHAIKNVNVIYVT